MDAPTPTAIRDDIGPMLKKLLMAQCGILAVLISLSAFNVVADLPHQLLGAGPTSFQRRWAEGLVEGMLYCIVVGFEVILILSVRHRLRVRHGVLPVCTCCGRVLHAGRWQALEQYITERSEASFAHTRCPECREAQQELENGHLRIVSGF